MTDELKYIYIIDENTPKPNDEAREFFNTIDLEDCDAEWQDDLTLHVMFRYENDYEKFVDIVSRIRKVN